MEQINTWLNWKNITGDTALSLAVKNHQHGIIKLLLNSHAVITTSHEGGNTPLHIASINSHEIVRLLLDTKSKNQFINKKNNLGETALFLAAKNKQQDVVSILIQNGADVTISNITGDTPVHRAAFNGHTEILKNVVGGHAR